MKEEKTKIASNVVMFSLHMCSFIFADFQDKPMGVVSVFTNRNLSTAKLTVRCCFVLLSFLLDETQSRYCGIIGHVDAVLRIS